MTTIGFIGSGNVGSQIARMAVRHGYDVVLSNSRGPETLAGLVAELGPLARAGTTSEAATAADIAVLAIPYVGYPSVPAAPLADKVVIDTTNYVRERDGRVTILDIRATTDSELVQEHLAASFVVKAFNHLRAAEISTDGTPAGTPQRRALALAGDDAPAKVRVAALYEQFGFDAVDVGPLSESWRLARGAPAQVARQTAIELRANIARAPRCGPGGQVQSSSAGTPRASPGGASWPCPR